MCNGERNTSYRSGVRISILVLFSLLVSKFVFAQQGDGTVLGNAAATLAPGEWTTISTINFVPAMTDIGIAKSILTFNNNNGYDPVTNRVIVQGIDHGGAGAIVTYDVATNTWTDHGAPDFLGGPPIFQHNWDRFWWDPVGRRMGIWWYEQNMDAANLASGWVEGTNPNAVFPYGCPNAHCSAKWVRGALHMAWGFGNHPGKSELWKKTSTYGSWTKVATGLVAPYGFDNFFVYDQVKDTALFGGGTDEFGASLDLYKIDGNGVSLIARPPIVHGLLKDDRQIITAEPVTGNWIMLRTDGKIYEYNVDGNSWSNVGTVPTSMKNWSYLHSPMESVAGISVPTYGVIMYIQHGFAGPSLVYVYKHGNFISGTVRPASPTNLFAQ